MHKEEENEALMLPSKQQVPKDHTACSHVMLHLVYRKQKLFYFRNLSPYKTSVNYDVLSKILHPQHKLAHLPFFSCWLHKRYL
jgi:LmbE family N-acetylglucosaminyl deacetylase